MPFFGNLIKRALALGAQLEKRPVSPRRLQEKTLRRLLRKASATAFGRHYNFRDLLKDENVVTAFQQAVPAFDYEKMHEQWWHLSLAEQENVSWPGRVRYFALSSGTSGAPSKQLPVTDDMLRAMRRAGLKMFFALTNFDIDPMLFTKNMLMLGGSTDLQNQGNYFLGDLSGINASKPPFWLRPYYKPGTEISRISSWDKRIEEIARKAPEWDVGFIVGIPSWLQLMMERIIEYHQLETIHDIWPNLNVCVHGGISFEPYRKGFEKLTAKPLVYMDSYLASEGFIAYQNRPETNAMKLVLNSGIFFEFIPFDETNFDEEGNLRNNPTTLTISQVEENVDYALLITTCAGAWRYLIGDTVKFTDKARTEIIITGRTKHFLSICGEHLSVDNMTQGIRHTEEELDIDIREFTVTAVKAGNHFAHQWYLGVDSLVDKQLVAPVLDAHLKAINADYETERTSVLKDIRVEVLPVEVFYDWQKEQGKMGGQNKFPRVMRDKVYEDWKNFLARHPLSKHSSGHATSPGRLSKNN